VRLYGRGETDEPIDHEWCWRTRRAWDHELDKENETRTSFYKG
jgi:hypothetical protein